MVKLLRSHRLPKAVIGMLITLSLAASACQTQAEESQPSSVSSASTQAADDNASPEASNALLETISQIEERLDARVGVAVYDKETGQSWEYHADDRFAMASTFKTLACATMLSRVDAGQEQLDRVIPFDERDLVTYSPVTETRVDSEGMSLFELCQATLSLSDNTAANLILEAVDGPQGVTEFLRSIGDDITQLDRWEPEVNEAIPGDERDTTTPNAMAMTIEKLVLGDVLSPESRQQLEDWLRGNEVGDALLRAGVPEDWQVADRTGAGDNGLRANVAVIWPPEREPVIATVYIAETNASFDDRNAAIAEIGTAIAEAVMQQ
ncbi:MAG: class A beta-lactamase [Cyanobacteria bacterium J06638_22]